MLNAGWKHERRRFQRTSVPTKHPLSMGLMKCLRSLPNNNSIVWLSGTDTPSQVRAYGHPELPAQQALTLHKGMRGAACSNIGTQPCAKIFGGWEGGGG